MSRYKAYPEYRDSGVEWLGAVPSHWEMSPLKYLAGFSGGGTPSKENPAFWNGNIPWVSPKDMKVRRVGATIDNITESAIKQSSTNLLEKGALLMVVRSGILQHSIPVAINDVPVSLNQDMKALRFAAPLLSEYAFYFVIGNQSSLLLEWSKEGATVESIEHEYLANTLFPCPPLKDRTAIIDFLDHETAKIDALIEKQQRLIELLKEKRQAVISHAVTKGLNPNAPMKHSGVEWLGEVPAHWLVAPLKRFAEVIDCKHYTVEFLDDGLPIVSIRELKDDLIDISNAKSTSRKEWDFLREGRIPQSGDIVFCRNASVGAAGYVNGDFDFCMGQDVCLIRTRKTNKYMHFQITSSHVREQIEAFLVGATIRRANVEEIRGLVVADPPESEQTEIEKYLDNALSEFNALSEKANQTVALLIERRTALISAAVTGKIDVRDWLPAMA